MGITSLKEYFLKQFPMTLYGCELLGREILTVTIRTLSEIKMLRMSAHLSKDKIWIINFGSSINTAGRPKFNLYTCLFYVLPVRFFVYGYD